VEQRYSYTLSLTSALDGGAWSTPRTGRFLPRGKDPVPIIYEDGWAPGPVCTGAENLAPSGIRSPNRPPPPEFDPRAVQPVVSHYTDCAIPSHSHKWVEWKYTEVPERSGQIKHLGWRSLYGGRLETCKRRTRYTERGVDLIHVYLKTQTSFDSALEVEKSITPLPRHNRQFKNEI
jgi:hypothetical protein